MTGFTVSGSVRQRAERLYTIMNSKEDALPLSLLKGAKRGKKQQESIEILRPVAEREYLVRGLCDELCRSLGKCIDEYLTEREAKIIRLRYGLNGGQSMPQRDVAKCCGISRSYVSRIEKKALEKLRQVLGEDACPT